MSSLIKNIENNPRCSLLLTLPYNDIIPFVFEYIKKRSVIFYLALLLLACFLAWIIITRIGLGSHYRFIEILPYSIFGFILIPIILIVPHELLHVLPYLLFGAKDIRIGMNLPQYYFYVSAHHHPVNALRFVIIAIFPFLTLSLAMIYLGIILSPLLNWSMSLALFVHASMCAGDFALLNFYFTNRNKEIITWDDADKKEAYFYAMGVEDEA